jgi:hypothetical protein
MAFTVLAAGALGRLCSSQTNVLTYHNDNARTGQNLTETILNPSNIRSSSFGKLFAVSVDGKLDAQPLYVTAVGVPGIGIRNVVYAATEHDSVYGFDADTGAIYWQMSMLANGEIPSDARGCGQVSPEIGITGTPVIDLQAGPHGTIYLVAMSKDRAGNYYQRLHALDITTGAEEFGGPVDIAATYPGSGDHSAGGNVIFDPKQYKSRPGLLLLNGTVYTGWGSHCDIRPYTGWIMGYNESTLQQSTVFNFAPNGNEAALWGAGGGIAADGGGNIFVQVANGTFDTTLNAAGFPSRGDYGNAFVRLGVFSNQLQATDYWTMDNTVAESSRDEDLGSGGPTLLPDLVDGNGNIRRLGTGAGKDGNIYVFDRDNMGKFDSDENATLYQELPGELGGGEYATPAWFNGTIYYGAVGDVIRAFQVSAAALSASPTSTTQNSFPYPGATPAISANRTSNAILWAVENSNPAVLHAYDANNLAIELYNSNQAGSGRDHFGAGNKFITPTVANGKVFAGTTNSVAVFGLLSAPAAVLSTGGLDFGSLPVGTTSAPVSVTLFNTGNAALTMRSISFAGTNPGDFTQNNDCGSSIAPGANCTVSISFQPSAAGTRAGSLTIADDAANSPQIVNLTGAGTGNESTYTISGQITFSTIGLAGVTVSLNGGSTTATDALGNYSFSGLAANGTYTIAPSLNGFQFLPPAQTFAGLNASGIANFSATLIPTSGPLVFVSVPACRVADTRNSDGPFGGPEMKDDSARDFSIVGSGCGIPANAAAYSLNVTAVPDGQLGYLTVWSAGQPRPGTSTLISDGKVKAGAAIVPAGTDGRVSIYVSNATHVVLDVNGFFTLPGTSAGLAFYPLTPCRVLDTRGDSNALGGPFLTGGTSRDFPILSSSCNIPSSAQAYSLNFTAVPHGVLGYISVWGTGQEQAVVSTLNASTGTVVANAAIAPAGSDGKISVFATDDTDLVMDVNGYFAPPGEGGLFFYSIPACRVLDSRNGAQPLAGINPVDVAGSGCSVPAAAQAYVLNATVVPSSALGYAALWADGQPMPFVSTLNALDGAGASNMAVVSTNNGLIDVFASDSTHLVVDIAGYFAP